MEKQLAVILLTLTVGLTGSVYSQSTSSQTAQPRPGTPARATTPAKGFNLSDYGVQIEPDARLVVVMAALEAAGYDPTPKGRQPSLFLKQLRSDEAGLDRDLQARLRRFYERNKLKEPATPAEDAARYVSLAFALGPAPIFDAPARTDDLPEGVLEVLDFAPLVREFYQKSGIEQRLPGYIRLYQAEGDRLRPATIVMVRGVLSYLHTQPVTSTLERVRNPAAQANTSKKKPASPAYTVRERERQLAIVPDLLAVPGTINFRVVGDSYYAVVPPGIDPASSELRRAYIQYLIDPLVMRHSQEIAARQESIRGLLDARKKTDAGGGSDKEQFVETQGSPRPPKADPNILSAVASSLVAAIDSRMTEVARLQTLSLETSARASNASAAARPAIIKESQNTKTAIEDEATAERADAYERGAVLVFYFAEQLRGQEISGFDIANFLSDMIASFDPARESRRPAEYGAARERALAARRSAEQANEIGAAEELDPGVARRARLIKNLSDVELLLKSKNYAAAEDLLRGLLPEFPGEPRIFFAFGEVASFSAQDAADPSVRDKLLERALANYRFAINAASADTDSAYISRAHVAAGRILAFFDRNTEAMKEFDAAIALGNVSGGAFQEAQKEKQRLTAPK